MNTYKHINSILPKLAKRSSVAKAIFYKTAPGEYAAHDTFIGISVPTLREVANQFKNLPTEELHLLLQSGINEERFLALVILVNQYTRGNVAEKETLYQFYLKNLDQVNNWNLVDASAHLIMGAHLLNSNKDILLSLAKSEVMWHRRIAIVSTWYFIRQNQFDWTIKISKILLEDSHDLIHKAVGWMLREMGKKDVQGLKEFLDQHAKHMPRTMLRYAIEKFPEDERKKYLGRR